LEPSQRLALRGFFFSDLKVLNKRLGENWCQNHLADQQVYQLLEKVDADLIEEARQQGCLLCEGKLHRSDYERKPRGGDWDDWDCWDGGARLCRSAHRGRQGPLLWGICVGFRVALVSVP